MSSLKPALFLVLILALVNICRADNLTIGSSLNAQLVHMEQVSLTGIPLKTRSKSVFYNGQIAIKGITALDLDKSKAKVSITAGGVGSTYVNLKLKSERGDGLNYQIQIYA
ncbi:unnamed protein product [Colias eurytheme]|nr:unnamed protein product [Colias eurytheme]